MGMGKRFGAKRRRPRKIGKPEIVNPWVGLSKWVIVIAVAGPTMVALLGSGILELGGSAKAAISGRAHVVDGDTLRIAGRSIRLHGIDAPEVGQQCTNSPVDSWNCGQEATRELSRKIDGQTISCSARDHDRYGRIVAVCVIDGEDLNAWMVIQGWAVAYTRYSWRYALAELVARPRSAASGRATSCGLRSGGGRTAADRGVLSDRLDELFSKNLTRQRVSNSADFNARTRLATVFQNQLFSRGRERVLSTLD